jgi:hypothetical protein
MKFSEEEIAALNDQRFFLLKHSATKKIVDRFGVMEAELKRRFSQFGIECPGLNFSAGKIFRGENYKLYPYVLLDYPRLFSSGSICAFRSMFWWGHEFSFTLHLQSDAFLQYAPKVYERLKSLNGREVYYCINNGPWQYDFGDDNYKPIESGISREEFFNKPFFKLSRKLPIAQHERVEEYCYETYGMFLGLLKSR